MSISLPNDSFFFMGQVIFANIIEWYADAKTGVQVLTVLVSGGVCAFSFLEKLRTYFVKIYHNVF
ncbi:MAG: hypothetical protein LBV41_11695 [Cytophagaceae bacterium]|nr:hypothetical protein [Cytophagaceae bacterium]